MRRRSGAVGRDAAGEHHAARVLLLRGADGLLDQHVHDGLLIGGGQFTHRHRRLVGRWLVPGNGSLRAARLRVDARGGSGLRYSHWRSSAVFRPEKEKS